MIRRVGNFGTHKELADGKTSKTAPSKQPDMIATTSTCEMGLRAPLYLSHKYDHSCLISGSLEKFVALPKYLDRKEWLATHGTITYLFFSTKSSSI